MLGMHLCVDVLNLLNKFATVVCIVNDHVVFLGSLFLLQCLQEAMPTVLVDMP